MTALTAPIPAHVIAAELTPTHDSLWFETEIRAAFAPTWQALAAQAAPVCRCGARHGERCRTRSGRVTRDHKGRAA